MARDPRRRHLEIGMQRMSLGTRSNDYRTLCPRLLHTSTSLTADVRDDNLYRIDHPRWRDGRLDHFPPENKAANVGSIERHASRRTGADEVTGSITAEASAARSPAGFVLR